MSLSLQEQLLKAGLVTEKQAKKAEQEQRAQHHKQHKQHPGAQQAQQQAEARRQAQAREQAAKVARDQELNRQRQEKAARKAMYAEIRQLVETHRLPRLESEEFFNFVHGRKIHRMAVDSERRTRLQNGELKIVRHAPGYAVVTPEIAARIAERDAQMVVDLEAKADANTETAADDPYKDFVVPDDLMW